MALASDSTNAVRSDIPVGAYSRRVVFKAFGQAGTAALSSHLLVQYSYSAIIDEARCGRLRFRETLINVVNVAANLGYLNVPDNVLVDIEMIRNYPANEMVIVTTGSQGEPMSALHRIAFSEHRQVEIIPGDMIIISANPIPGNEKLVNKVINELMKRGANVVYERMYDVHVSGHACQEELKLMMSI
ncbi:MAG: RNase J family beta-CASP ribonuclease, partial [Oscillospiraceae bacterium]